MWDLPIQETKNIQSINLLVKIFHLFHVIKTKNSMKFTNPWSKAKKLLNESWIGQIYENDDEHFESDKIIRMHYYEQLRRGEKIIIHY